jgi:hypothetical protein
MRRSSFLGGVCASVRGMAISPEVNGCYTVDASESPGLG